MSRYQHTLTLTLALIAALLLAACNVPASQQATPTQPAPPTTAPEPTSAPPAAAATTPPDDPAGDDSASITDGWATLTSAEFNLTVQAPDGWELTPTDENSSTLRETGGEGRAELTVLDATSAPRLGIDYRPGADAVSTLQGLLVGFREDGDFTSLTELETSGGRAAAFSEGSYQPFDERLVVGVVALPDRAVVLTGHGPASSQEGGEEEWARLRPIYEGMLQSIAPAD